MGNKNYGATNVMSEKVCLLCGHREVCYIFKNIKEGRKWYSEYFDEGVVCPFWFNRNKVETNIFDQVERYEDCTVEILTNSVTGEQSIGWFKNDNPPVELGGIQE